MIKNDSPASSNPPPIRDYTLFEPSPAEDTTYFKLSEERQPVTEDDEDGVKLESRNGFRYPESRASYDARTGNAV